MESNITLKELSFLSGFSVSTVSKALNNKLDISKKTRQKIKRIANENDYVPNNYAVALRKKRTQAIAVILPQINNPFYSCFLHHIEKISSSHGYKIVLYQSFEKEVKEVECIKNSNDGSVDGVIMLSKNNLQTKSLNINLPVEHIQATKDLSLKQLKKDCIKSFSNLLKHLN